MLADMFRVPLLALGASVDATPALRRVAGLAVAVAVSVYLARQVRKPSRWIGRPFLWAMNNYHSGVTEWGLQQVTIDEAASILDVGCGGGRTVQRLAARAPRGTVCGIDYADGSIEVARRANARLIETGRVDIRKASVSELPFADATFDFVTAVETHYYWPDPANDMREIRRVLKPGGTLAVIAETYRRGRFDVAERMAMKLLASAHLSADEHRAVFETAGYSDVQIAEEQGKGWICAMGSAPSVVSRDTSGPAR
jgi:SAM-dependent methyltransferase